MTTETLTWQSARTLRDLGELNARQLESADYGSDHGHFELPPFQLVPLLAVLNRAGLFTAGAQLGTEPDENGTEQRAAIEFFVTWPFQVPPTKAAKNAGLIVRARSPRSLPRWRDRRRNLIPVTRRNGKMTDALGADPSRRAIAYSYSDCHRDARRQLAAAWYITVIDPKWGPSDRLWRTLAGIVLSPRGEW